MKAYLGNYKEFDFVELKALVALEGKEHEMKWALLYRYLLGKLLDQICILEPYSHCV